MKKILRIAALCCMIGASLSAGTVADGDQFVSYFPQVAKGRLGLWIESALVVTNTSADPVTVNLDSFNLLLLQPVSLELAPGATGSVKIAGGDFQVGWVRLRSSVPVAATATIVIKEEEGSQEAVSQASILAQQAAAKVTVPVFRGSSFADETGVAIAAVAKNDVTLTLRDEAGNVVASRTLSHKNRLTQGDFSDHLSGFIGDLFPTLGDDFSGGSLTLEGPQEVPRTFAAAALYTIGSDLLSAPVTNVDVPGQYLVQLKSTEDLESTLAEMGEQYGFTLLEWVTQGVALVSTTDERARAVSRDPRVSIVEPNALISGG